MTVLSTAAEMGPRRPTATAPAARHARPRGDGRRRGAACEDFRLSTARCAAAAPIALQRDGGGAGDGGRVRDGGAAERAGVSGLRPDGGRRSLHARRPGGGGARGCGGGNRSTPSCVATHRWRWRPRCAEARRPASNCGARCFGSRKCGSPRAAARMRVPFCAHTDGVVQVWAPTRRRRWPTRTARCGRSTIAPLRDTSIFADQRAALAGDDHDARHRARLAPRRASPPASTPSPRPRSAARAAPRAAPLAGSRAAADFLRLRRATLPPPTRARASSRSSIASRAARAGVAAVFCAAPIIGLTAAGARAAAAVAASALRAAAAASASRSLAHGSVGAPLEALMYPARQAERAASARVSSARACSTLLVAAERARAARTSASERRGDRRPCARSRRGILCWRRKPAAASALGQYKKRGRRRAGGSGGGGRRQRPTRLNLG